MGCGIVICSICKREVHQDGPWSEVRGTYGWRHCEDKSRICKVATVDYPETLEQIKGKWCGVDACGPEE